MEEMVAVGDGSEPEELHVGVLEGDAVDRWEVEGVALPVNVESGEKQHPKKR